MLVHVTRLVDVQQHVWLQIQDVITTVQRRLRYGDGTRPDSILEDFERLWSTFEQTTKKFEDPLLTALSWDEIQPFLARATTKIEVRRINGSVKDVLAYSEYPDGLNCIAVGGDKLSRGLTLEGLTVSYYLRATRMYDTLMQMGRWFGYRDGYIDLCRLYTTEELIDWYQDITDASEELRREFDYMAAMGSTPDEFGLRVRSHPAGLLVTAAAKMRNGLHLQLSFAKTISETIIFHKERTVIDANFSLTNSFIISLGEPASDDQSRKSGMQKWRCNEPDKIINFLEKFQTHPAAQKVQTSVLTRYIKSRVLDDELIEWTVGLASGKGPEKFTIGGHTIDLVKRSSNGDVGDNAFRIKRLVSPADEDIDLSFEEKQAALDDTQIEWIANPGRSQRKNPSEMPTTPSGLAIRTHRSPQRGLLLLYPLNPGEADLTGNPLIGLAISFPDSKKAGTVSYVVNNTYWEQEFGGDE